MNKALRISLSIIFVVLYILICFIPTNSMTVSALNISVEGGYTTALEDLSTDENFNVEDYPMIEDDYSLQVMQIAESSDKELFVYVYQPSADHMNLRASSINISCSLHIKENIKNYELNFLNKQGVFYKYVVDGLSVSDETTRYYEVISIYRPWDENIDKGLDPINDNTIDEVVFKVAKQYTFINSDDGVITSVSELETIEITDKFVGFIRYKDGFDLNAYDGGCDSHFVAFSTDKPIDKLYEADVYFTTQEKRFTAVYTVGGGSEYSYGSVEPDYEYLNYEQNASYETDGFGGRKYSWKRINSVDDFLKDAEGTNIFSVAMFDVFDEETLTDVAEANLKSKQWVLRFTETDYTDVYTSAMRDISKTSVGDVTVLRLKFETNGNVYDLPVIDNKQTGSENSATEHNYEFKLNDMFKIILMLLLIIILIVIFAPILPTIISAIIWIIKIVFKIVWWVISLPFKLFSKNKKKTRY